ncbi:hypothetical protein CERSUDRAFT_57020 [Gelatoporia subvermispora B]|uniref:Homeobox domain-containing protein n=1 Tax=Ceriporiopsis subvermispora (strain B) TaxID=914234 RepID=M2R304_CERS8|nr:hypothetical protein CERSUDRAFT_57020 [Gelatoporia subvermispora B]
MVPTATGIRTKHRKRSRMTPDQLAYLETAFADTNNPNTLARQSIGAQLNMTERQVQVWFQNRRTKEKLLNTRKAAPPHIIEPPPDLPPTLSMGFDRELAGLLNENAPVTIISCDYLSIGTWRRASSGSGKHDLVAYICEQARYLAWFVHSYSARLKMEISFDAIVEAKFSNISPGVGKATFVLSHPPSFYVDTSVYTSMVGSSCRYWRQCGDWTEAMQATDVLRHDLVGAAAQMACVAETVNSSLSAGIQLLAPHTWATSSYAGARPEDLYHDPFGACLYIRSDTKLIQ